MGCGRVRSSNHRRHVRNKHTNTNQTNRKRTNKMSDLNSVTIIGRLTRDAEIKHTHNGTTIANISIASNTRTKQSNEWVDKANFFDATGFGARYEKLGEYLTKGKRVGITGRLDYQAWETDQGAKRSRVGIIISDINLLDSKETSAPSASQHLADSFGGSIQQTDDGYPF